MNNSVNMKKSKVKTSRKKVIPHCYQKKSNATLSQLICTGAYKKRIKILENNNRCLAKALQISRCEVATQSNLIKDYQGDINQIMLAKLKLKDMAKSITQLVTWMDEVVDIISATRFAQRNWPPNDVKLRVKAPSLDNIEEVSVLSQDNKISSEENASPYIPETDHETISADVNQADSLECGLDSHEVSSDAVPPILFAEESEDSEGKNKEKKSSKSKCSRRQSSIDHRSLTPKLDIDWKYHKRTRSNSRRQSQIFSGSTGSNKLSRSPDSEIPQQNESRESVTSPPELLSQSLQYHNGDDIPADFLPVCTSPKLVSCALPNIELIPEASNHTLLLCEDMELTDVVSHAIKIICENNIEAVAPSSSNSEIASDVPDQKTMKSQIKEKNIAENELGRINEGCISFVEDGNASQEYQTKNSAESIGKRDYFVKQIENIQTPENIKSYDNNSKSSCLKNTANYAMFFTSSEDSGSEHTPSKFVHHKTKNKSIAKDECNVVNKKYKIFVEGSNASQEHQTENSSVNIDQEDHIIKQNENIKTPENNKSKISLRKTTAKYAPLYFTSSDDSETEHTPPKSGHHMTNKSKEKRTTVIYRPKASPNISKAKDHCFLKRRSSGNRNNARLNNISLYDFDHSFSEKPSNNNEVKTSKKSKLSRNKKSVQKKDVITKPLLQNCNVTKFKGFEFKFSKNQSNDIGDKHSDTNKQLKQSEPVSDINSCTSLDSLIKKDKLILDNVHKDKTETSNKNNVSSVISTGEYSPLTPSVFSPNTSILKQDTSSKKARSESKRVSFASTDLVCNFKRMSVSKTIADNEKVKRTSKSAVNINVLAGQTKIEAKKFQQLNSIDNNDDLFCFSDETEVCALSVAANINVDCLALSKQHPPEYFISSIAEQKNSSAKCNENQKETTLTTKEDINDYDFGSSEETELYTIPVNLRIADAESFTRNDQPSVSKITVSTVIEQKQASGKSNENRKLNKIDLMSNDINKVQEKRIFQNASLQKIPNVKHISATKSTISSSAKAKDKRQTRRLFSGDFKENLKQTPEIISKITRRNSKTLFLLQSSKNNFDNKVNTDISVQHKSKVSEVKKIAHLKSKKSKLTPGESKKSGTGAKSAESSPVLKDMMNLPSLYSLSPKTSADPVIQEEIESSENLPKRRSRPVSYKEPSLNKKLRRE